MTITRRNVVVPVLGPDAAVEKSFWTPDPFGLHYIVLRISVKFYSPVYFNAATNIACALFRPVGN